MSSTGGDIVGLTVRTLASEDYAFYVDEVVNVRQLKEIISPTIGIPVDQQRLLIRGRVLQDDKPICEYGIIPEKDVQGNVIRVVDRNPNNATKDESRCGPNSQTADGTVAPPSPSTTRSLSRCAASFGSPSSSPSPSPTGMGSGVSSSTGGKAPVDNQPGGNGDSTSSSTKVKQNSPVLSSGDANLDEFLQFLSPMMQGIQVSTTPRPQGDTESIIRNLPAEWKDVIMEDIKSQKDMPEQLTFSEEYCKIIPRIKKNPFSFPAV